MLKTGLIGHAETVVCAANTAMAAGSGLAPVFATPCMVALMEEACYTSVIPFLAEGQGTVGTKLNISHESATPIDMKVWADSELKEVDRRRLVFSVTVYDECGVIGRGTHERFIIDNEKFINRANSKGRAK